MKPVKILPGWRTELPVMEKAFRSMGMFDAAERARMKLEAGEWAEAQGHDSVLDCEWYDRGRSELPYLWKDRSDRGAIAYFGPISVALQRDQMEMLWSLLTVALFQQGSDALWAMSDLVSACYDEDELRSEFFKDEGAT